MEQLRQFVNQWTKIPSRNDRNESQSKDWSGIYWISYQDVASEKYFKKLKNTLIFIKNHPQYKLNGFLYITPFHQKDKENSEFDNTGEEICKCMHEYTNSYSNDRIELTHYELFSKLEKRFLLHLGFIEIDYHHIQITELGNEFINTNNLNEENHVYANALLRLVWRKRPQYNIHPFVFALKLLKLLPTQSFTLDEYKMIISHAKFDNDIDKIFNYIISYRKLSMDDKKDLEVILEETRKLENPNEYQIEIDNFANKHNKYLIDMGFVDGLEYKDNVLKIVDIDKIDDFIHNFELFIITLVNKKDNTNQIKESMKLEKKIKHTNKCTTKYTNKKQMYFSVLPLCNPGTCSFCKDDFSDLESHYLRNPTHRR